MGKPGKKEQAPPQKKRKDESSEQEEEEDDEEQVYEENDEGDDGEEGEDEFDEEDLLDPEISDREEQLLEKINEEIMNVQEPLKLTWAAIHKLKTQQKALNEQMDEQMRKIQQKFQLLKTPLSHKIASIASGQHFEKQLYSQHELTKTLSINKHKPQAIPGFWKKALESVGFVHGEEDSKILESCTGVECGVERKGEGEGAEEVFRVVFRFGENQVIENKELRLVVERKGDQFTKKELTPIKFKQAEPEEEKSFFGQVFSPETEAQDLYAVASDLQRAYNNSVFYYFYEGQLIGQEQAALEDEDLDDEDEDDSEEDVQPVKKKPVTAGQGSAKPAIKAESKGKGQGQGQDKNKNKNKGGVEKPECNNQ